jgi:hypothetical protein
MRQKRRTCYFKRKNKNLKKGDNAMKLSRLWKFGAIAAIIGIVALVASACAGTTTVTATPKTVTATVTAPAVTKVAQTLILQADMVIGAAGVTNPADIYAVSSRCPQGAQVCWRVKVIDPATGQPMDDKALNSVKVSVWEGQTFTAVYGAHPGAPPDQPQPPATDHFWTAVWVIPANYPTGRVLYTISATSKDGRMGTFNQFNVAPSLLTVVAAQ